MQKATIPPVRKHSARPGSARTSILDGWMPHWQRWERRSVAFGTTVAAKRIAHEQALQFRGLSRSNKSTDESRSSSVLGC
jgi:hypothetical protein